MSYDAQLQEYRKRQLETCVTETPPAKVVKREFKQPMVECPICYHKLKNDEKDCSSESKKMMSLCCGHVYCVDCVDILFTSKRKGVRKCYICSKRVYKKQCRPIYFTKFVDDE